MNEGYRLDGGGYRLVVTRGGTDQRRCTLAANSSGGNVVASPGTRSDAADAKTSELPSPERLYESDGPLPVVAVNEALMSDVDSLRRS